MDLAAAVSLTELRNDIRPIQNDECRSSPALLDNNGDLTVSSQETSSNPSKNNLRKGSKGISNNKSIITSSPPGFVLNPAPFFYYCDRSDEIDDDPLTPLTPPGRTPNFPATMHAILFDSALKDVIAWMPHGRSWRILNPRELEIRVLPKYFEHNKFSSFIRQTNGWGFRRLTKGPDRHSYYNENFLRGLPHLCKKMKRVGSASKITLDPSYEPNLYEINKLHPLPTAINFVDESINFQVSRVGPRTRMPVTYGAFDATKPANRNSAINNSDIQRLLKRKNIDVVANNTNKLTDVKHKQLKPIITSDQKSETNSADILQQSSSSTNNDSACNILSTSLREISTLHLEAAYRAQILSQLYNNNFLPSIQQQTMTSNNDYCNINQLYDIYQPVVNPLSTHNTITIDSNKTDLQEQLRNILEKNKISSHP